MHIACPPFFHGKLYDMFLAVVINKIGAQAAFVHKTLLAAHVACLQKVLFLAQCAFFQNRRKICLLFSSKGYMPGNVFKYELEHI